MEQTEKKRVIKLLELYPEIDGNIKMYKRIVADLNEEYYLPPTSEIYGGGSSSGKVTKMTENLAMDVPNAISREIRGYEDSIKEYEALKTEMLKEMSRLQYRQKAIVFDKYVHGLKWEQVAVRNHYSSRQCKNIRNAAVENLGERFKRNRVIAKFKIDK